MTIPANTVMGLIFKKFTVPFLAENVKEPSASVWHGTLPAVGQIILRNCEMQMTIIPGEHFLYLFKRLLRHDNLKYPKQTCLPALADFEPA